MKSEVATVRRVTLSRDEVEEAIIEHIEAFHDLQLKQLHFVEALLSRKLKCFKAIILNIRHCSLLALQISPTNM